MVGVLARRAQAAVLLCVAVGLLPRVAGLDLRRPDQPRCSSDHGDDAGAPRAPVAPRLQQAAELDGDGDGLQEHASAWSLTAPPPPAIHRPVTDSRLVLAGPGHSLAPTMDRGPPRPRADAGNGRSPRRMILLP